MGGFPAGMNACALLDKFVQQEGLGSEKSYQVNASAVRKITEAFVSFIKKKDADINATSGCCESLSRNINYGANDIEAFSKMLPSFESKPFFSRHAGYFLSFLVCHGKDQDYTLDLRDISTPIDDIGYSNRKNLTVHGDVGAYVGRNNAMAITINGNLSGRVGIAMKECGIIHVNGNMYGLAGHSMHGTIIQNGKTIYHKGKFVANPSNK